MAKAANNYRYERKFLISELDPHEIESLVKLHPAMFAQAYPPRLVNNIYFDSLDFKCYCETMIGASARTKVRIRWYGDLLGPIEKPTLELKNKQALLGTKRSFPLSPFQLDETFDASSVTTALEASDLPPQFQLQLLSLRPWLINRYRRQYYLSADGCFRVTIDTEMAWYDPTGASVSLGPRYSDRFHTVVELKYDQYNDDHARSITNAFPFRLTRNSKYTNGIDRLILN